MKNKTIESLNTRRDRVVGMEIFSRFSQPTCPQGRKTIVLVHGLSMSSLYMAPTAACLAYKYCIYAPDLPGYGRSTKPPEILTIGQLASILEAWMEALSLGEVVLLGNSLGCQVAVELALQNPDRASRLVLSGLTPDPGHKNFPQHLLRLLLAGLREPVSFIPVLIRDYMAAGLRRTLVTARFTLEDAVEQKLPRVHAPSLVVRGSKDPIITQEWAETAAQLLPAGKLAVIPGGGHAVNWSYAQPLSEIVDEFLEA